MVSSTSHDTESKLDTHSSQIFAPRLVPLHDSVACWQFEKDIRAIQKELDISRGFTSLSAPPAIEPEQKQRPKSDIVLRMSNSGKL